MQERESKTIEYDPFVPDYTIERIDRPEGRLYRTPDGLFPSVTTVIGAASDKSFLDEWRERIGHEEADRISSLMRNFGTRMHEFLEVYIKTGQEPKPVEYGYDVWEAWLDHRPEFMQNLNKVVGVELQMYSKTIQMAGTADCLGYWNGIPSIIDFKTSYKSKKKEWIGGYFVQAVFYSVMAQERFGFTPKQIVIPIFTRMGQPSIFIERIRDYYEPAYRTIERARKAGVYTVW